MDPTEVPADDDAIQQRNAFFETLAPGAKERFLETLVEAREHGLDEQAAWQEATRAAQLAYPPDEPMEERNL